MRVGKELERYGRKWGRANEATVELLAFSRGAPEGLGRYEHMRRAIDRIWNDVNPGVYMWNEWSEGMVREFCEEKWVVVSGPGASWKTTSAAIYCLASWYASPA